MSATKSVFTFVELPKVLIDPVQKRRAKLIDGLKQQLALNVDPALKKLGKRRSKASDGSVSFETIERPVPRWWTMDEKGTVVLSVRYGFRVLEFEKGKPGVMVGPIEKLPAVLEALIGAVGSGEFDNLLAGWSVSNVPSEQTMGRKSK